MNYLKVYCNLIRKAEQRNYTKKKAKEKGVYVEGHHTFPKSIYGNNKRIVYLAAREHYIAHALLEKICIKRYGLKHYKTIKMNQAFCSMSAKNKTQVRYTSVLYENCKKRMSELKTGIKFSIERRENISKSLKGKSKPPKSKEHIEKFSKKMKGIKKEEEHKNKISVSHKKFWENGGRDITGEKNPFYNKNHTIETKEKLSDSKCKYVYTFISPDGEIFKTINALKFCKENNLFSKFVYEVVNGKRESYKGWTATRRSITDDDK